MTGPYEVSSDQIKQYLAELSREAKKRMGTDDLGLRMSTLGLSNFGSMWMMYPGVREDAVIVFRGGPDDSYETQWENMVAYICGSCDLSEREDDIYGIGDMRIENLMRRTPKYPREVALRSVPEDMSPDGIKSFAARQFRSNITEKFRDDKVLQRFCETLDQIVN